jgi:hypothetical protein
MWHAASRRHCRAREASSRSRSALGLRWLGMKRWDAIRTSLPLLSPFTAPRACELVIAAAVRDLDPLTRVAALFGQGASFNGCGRGRTTRCIRALERPTPLPSSCAPCRARCSSRRYAFPHPRTRTTARVARAGTAKTSLDAPTATHSHSFDCKLARLIQDWTVRILDRIFCVVASSICLSPC